MERDQANAANRKSQVGSGDRSGESAPIIFPPKVVLVTTELSNPL